MLFTSIFLFLITVLVLFPQKMQYLPLSFKWISDAVTRLPDWHNRQGSCLVKSVPGKTMLQVQEWNTCFPEQLFVADFMSLSFLQTAHILILIAQLKTKITLLYLLLTFYYGYSNRSHFSYVSFHTKLFSLFSLVVQQMLRLQVILWINLKLVYYFSDHLCSSQWGFLTFNSK